MKWIEMLVERLSQHRSQERGAGLAEYVLLLVLVAAAMTTAFAPLVTSMTTRLTSVAGLFN